MDKKVTFELGQEVWVIERDQDGNARDVSGYLLMAQGDGVVILTSYINDYDWEETLEYHIECTREDYDTHLAVFPSEDCFADRDACEAAFVAEQEEPHGTE